MEQTYNRIIGEYLGYPPCCIRAFGDVAMFFVLRPELTKAATVNGFLPCESCAKKLLAKEITYEELINPRRKCPIPFKTQHNPYEERRIDEKLVKLKSQ